VKILNIIPNLGRGGAECFLVRHCRHLGSLGHDTVIVSLAERNDFSSQELGEIEVVFLNFGSLLSAPRELYKLIRIIRLIKPDLICAWMYHAALLSVFLKTKKIPIVWNIRQAKISLDKDKLSTVVIAVLAGIFSWITPSTIITNSKNCRMHHRKIGYDVKNFVFIGNGIDQKYTQFDMTPNQKSKVYGSIGSRIIEDTIVLGFVGRDDKQKNFPFFVEILEEARKTGDRYIGVAAGNGLQEASRRSISSSQVHEVDGYLNCCGLVENMPSFYNSIDILISCSLGEGAPNCIFEAIACKVPVLAYDVGDIGHMVGTCGIVLEDLDKKEFIKAIVKIVENRSEFQKILDERSLLSAEDAGNMYEKVYLNIIRSEAIG